MPVFVMWVGECLCRCLSLSCESESVCVDSHDTKTDIYTNTLRLTWHKDRHLHKHSLTHMTKTDIYTNTLDVCLCATQTLSDSHDKDRHLHKHSRCLSLCYTNTLRLTWRRQTSTKHSQTHMTKTDIKLAQRLSESHSRRSSGLKKE